MSRISKTALALTLALAWMPACDKGKEGADKSGDAKKTDEHAGHGKDDGKSAEVAEVAADGRIDIEVDASGYHPDTISAPAKSKITLAFTRTTNSGCGQQLVIKSLDITKDLPLKEVVEIEVEVPETGELGFACGMDMYKGKVVAK